MSIREEKKQAAWRAEQGFRIMSALQMAGWLQKNIALAADIPQSYVSRVLADNYVLKDDELKRLTEFATKEGIKWRKVKAPA